jgi:hypothetical protein
LVASQRPNYTIRLPRLSAHAVGQFIQLWEIVTAYAGLMLDIDAYDQPAVETGKVATFGLMGRAGYGEWKSRVDETLKPTKWVCGRAPAAGAAGCHRAAEGTYRMLSCQSTNTDVKPMAR